MSDAELTISVGVLVRPAVENALKRIARRNQLKINITGKALSQVIKVKFSGSDTEIQAAIREFNQYQNEHNNQ